MNKKYILLAIILILFLGVWYVFRNTGSPKNEEVKENMNIEVKNEEVKNTIAIIKTNFGDIKIELFDSLTPNTVANFIKLADAGFYNGTKFHRVMKGFMIQGGDPLSKDDSKKELWGTGGPGYKFNDEISSQNHNNLGTIAMANAGPNTNGSQFFINVVDNNYLDSKHTVFGKAVEGLDVALRISETSVGVASRPIENVIINSIEILR
jgi:peptidylprolyl isomerase